MIKPSLFSNDRETYTEEAQTIDNEFHAAITAIVNKYKERFLVRELQYIAESAATEVCLCALLGIGDKK